MKGSCLFVKPGLSWSDLTMKPTLGRELFKLNAWHLWCCRAAIIRLIVLIHFALGSKWFLFLRSFIYYLWGKMKIVRYFAMQNLQETIFFLIELSCTSKINSMQYCGDDKKRYTLNICSTCMLYKMLKETIISSK